jgi:hypothetical protein
MKLINLLAWENMLSVNMGVEMKFGVILYSQTSDRVTARNARFIQFVLTAEQVGFT